MRQSYDCKIKELAHAYINHIISYAEWHKEMTKAIANLENNLYIAFGKETTNYYGNDRY